MFLFINYDSLHLVLRNLYEEMMPLCEGMAIVARGLAGIGAMLYVAYRVWQSLSRAEPIDVLPLLRPFAIGICIMFFPVLVLGGINGLLSPISKATHSLVEERTFKMEEFQRQKDKLEEATLYADPEAALFEENKEFDHEIMSLLEPEEQTLWSKFSFERTKFKIKQFILNGFRELLQIIFKGASLVIDTLRTFFLIVLAILGPISFAVSVFDGFQNTLVMWISRYVSVYLWLPVSDLFGAILTRVQELMLFRDIQELSANPNYIPDGSGTFLIIFMFIGIIGYFSIPTVCNWIIQAGGMGSYMRNVNSATTKAGKTGSAVVGGLAGNVSGKLIK